MADDGTLLREGTQRSAGARWLVWAVMLCGLGGAVQAGERDRVGLSVNTGIGNIQDFTYLTAGATVDARLVGGLHVLADGQTQITIDGGYSTLTAGLTLRPRGSRRVAPYLTGAAGVWKEWPDEGPETSARLYAFVGVGARLRISRGVSLFGEMRTTLHMAGSQPLYRGTAVLLGTRFGF